LTRITTTDQVLLLLRAQLERLRKARGQEKAASASRQQTQSPIERLKAIVSAEALGPQLVDRALITSLLIEEFGDEIANDPRFQRLSEEVHRLIAESDAGRDLIRDAAAQLGARS
jgi:hypothetical protein